MGSVVPLHAHPAHAEADRLAREAPTAAAFRAGSLGAQARLLSLLGTDAPLPVLLDALARYVETWAPSMFCSILLREPRRNVLVRGAAPSLPPAYVAGIGEVPIGEGVGCCGTAAATGECVMVFDIATSPLWNGFSALALDHGLRACWSMPFKDDAGEVLGTLALYYETSRAPVDAERDLIAFAAALARMVVLQHRRLTALWQTQERVTLERSVIEAAELEREQLALDLHDGVCQQLVGIEWLLAAEASRATDAAADTGRADSLRSLRDLVAGVQRDVRTLATWLLPLSRHPHGLEEALLELARDTRERHRVACETRVRVECSPWLEPQVRDQLLRIVQAAVSYSVPYGACSSIVIALDCGAGELALDVTVDTAALAAGDAAVLRAVRYRALQVGASLAFVAPEDGHSALQLRMPLTAPPTPG